VSSVWRFEIPGASRHHGPTDVTADGTAVPFEREANPYRSGGARLPTAALAPLLTAGENEIVAQLG